MQHRISMHWEPNHTGQDVTQPAISALDHLAIDAGTQHTASHQEVFFQGARLHHQGRPCVWVFWGLGAHLWGEAPCRQIPQRTGPWPLALGVSGGWENQVDVRLSWGFLLLPRPQICCSARFSRAAAVVQGVLKNTAVFTTGWDIFFSRKGAAEKYSSPFSRWPSTVICWIIKNKSHPALVLTEHTILYFIR